MDRETSEAFARVLEYITNSISGVIESNESNMTEYIKSLGDKIVNYKQSIATMWIIISIVAIIIGIVLIIIENKTKTFEGNLYLAGIAVIIFAIIIGVYNTYTYIECTTFQEKVIIDYIEEVYNTKCS